jgi:hypothetical protein
MALAQGTTSLEPGEVSVWGAIGTSGVERINDTGHRWSLPLTGGVHVKFRGVATATRNVVSIER